MPGLKLALVASNSPKSLQIEKDLSDNNQFFPVSDCDLVVVLGGDGFMLHTMHSFGHLKKPFYGINTGTVGFLMNTYNPQRNLFELVKRASVCKISQLEVKIFKIDGSNENTKAINEIYLLRESGQAAHIKISVNDDVKINKLVGDGIIIATPAGSTAYNLSANGPIIPLGSQLLAMTPISVYKPRSWKGALLPDSAKITLEVLNPTNRPVNLYADIVKFPCIEKVEVSSSQNPSIEVWFDPGHNLEERIINEQFAS